MSTLVPAGSGNAPAPNDLFELKNLLQQDLEKSQSLMPPAILPPFKQLRLPRSGKHLEYKTDTATFQFPYFIGQILHIQYFQQLWQNRNVVCCSDDGIMSRATGVAFPNTLCKTCPKNQFVPVPGGKTKRPECSKKARLYIQPYLFNPQQRDMSYADPFKMEGNDFIPVSEHVAEPYFMDVPPTSLKSITDYLLACQKIGSMPLPYTACVALISAIESTNVENQVYSKLDLRPLAPVSKTMFLYKAYAVEKYNFERTAIEVTPEDVDAPPAAETNKLQPPQNATMPGGPTALGATAVQVFPPDPATNIPPAPQQHTLQPPTTPPQASPPPAGIPPWMTQK